MLKSSIVSTIQKTIPFSLIFFVKLNKKKKIVRLLAFTKTIITHSSQFPSLCSTKYRKIWKFFAGTFHWAHKLWNWQNKSELDLHYIYIQQITFAILIPRRLCSTFWNVWVIFTSLILIIKKMLCWNYYINTLKQQQQPIWFYYLFNPILWPILGNKREFFLVEK